ncbi:MmcQ/YjbR family DNA-binding protein [Nakamurella silvestris]|nr:MmcQ/YjbR family DNA-binding protein [Nakamurella silvestris]
MASEDDVRRICLGLPETTENAAWGMPTFRVKNKIFASLGSEPGVLGFAVDQEERRELIASAPQIYFLKSGHDDNYHFARARLPQIDVEELAELLTESWRRIAPVRVRRAFDEGA